MEGIESETVSKMADREIEIEAEETSEIVFEKVKLVKLKWCKICRVSAY